MLNRFNFAVALVGYLVCLLCEGHSQQSPEDERESYVLAMKSYDDKDFPKAALEFQKYIELANEPSKEELYNGACIFALANRSDKALKLLENVAYRHFYANLNHVANDSDLESLHESPRWVAFIERVKENKLSEPKRLRKSIKAELMKAKQLLVSDGGELWGTQIWSNNVIVLGFDNTIYSLVELPGSKTDDGVLFYKSIPENTLSFTNSAQDYLGKKHAVVMTNYLDDHCSTIIHELFHLLQLKAREFRSDPVNYLDNYRARILLRSEYQALKNSLAAANENREADSLVFLRDAIRFRKIRQSENPESYRDESEIETLEGMANYTGLKLSTYENKLLRTKREITGRESASTYTRAFPYATGPAYGLLFDFLEIDWRSKDFNTIYNFKMIFEDRYGEVGVGENELSESRARNNYSAIESEEIARKEKHEANIRFYTRTLLNQPTLNVKPVDEVGSYSMSYDMYGTLVLENEGIVYSQLKVVGLSETFFGNFNTIPGKDRLGKGGVLLREDGEFVFSMPTKIEKNRIIGDSYVIELDEGWKVSKADDFGNLEIIPMQTK